jgi:hypothetical protein
MRQGTAIAGVASAIGVVTAGVVYLKAVRPWVLTRGATREETKRRMPGDDILANASIQATRAITIECSPDCIWPWLVQMGPRPRAGAYTYDWIERLLGIDIENTDRILPEFQHLEPGEYIGLNEKGQGIEVRKVEPERFVVLQWIPAKSTWTFALYPQGDGTTRLVSRNRLPGSGPLFWLGMVAFMEPGSLIMERKMLLGIKERAERLWGERRTSSAVAWQGTRESPARPT